MYLSDGQHGSNNNKSSSTRAGRRAAAAAAEKPTVQYEPFDARKRARVEELAREEEDLMREIAVLKRRVPGAAARTYADGFWDGVRGDEEALEAARARAAAVLDGEDEKGSGTRTSVLAGLGSIDRVDDVERGYVGVVDALGRLKRDMPATVAKMERARVAGEYVVTER